MKYIFQFYTSFTIYRQPTECGPMLHICLPPDVTIIELLVTLQLSFTEQHKRINNHISGIYRSICAQKIWINCSLKPGVVEYPSSDHSSVKTNAQSSNK